MSLLLFICHTLLSVVYASPQTVAILEFTSDDVPTSYLHDLSDQVRSSAVQTLTEEYVIYTRENIEQILLDQGKTLMSSLGANDIDTGRNLNASIVITGQVSRINQTFVLNIKMYQTSDGKLLSTCNVQANETLELYNRSFEDVKIMLASTLLETSDGGMISETEQMIKIDAPIVDPNLSGLAKLMWEEEQEKALEVRFAEIEKEHTVLWSEKSAKAWKSIQPYLKTNRSTAFVNEFLSEFGNIEVQVRYVNPVDSSNTVKTIPIITPEVIIARRFLLDLGYTEVSISKGQYIKGCTLSNKSQCDSDELPKQTVHIDKNLSVMTTEVSQTLFLEIMQYNPSAFQNCSGDCPVNQLSWYEAAEFANKLNQREGFAQCYKLDDVDSLSETFDQCNGWRIPTDDEWEFIAQPFKSKSSAVGWNQDNSGEQIHTSCSLQKVNGLCDILGNVSEWTGIPEGQSLARGGNWQTPPQIFRVSYKSNAGKDTRSHLIGVRLVRTIE